MGLVFYLKSLYVKTFFWIFVYFCYYNVFFNVLILNLIFFNIYQSKSSSHSPWRPRTAPTISSKNLCPWLPSHSCRHFSSHCPPIYPGVCTEVLIVTWATKVHLGSQLFNMHATWPVHWSRLLCDAVLCPKKVCFITETIFTFSPLLYEFKK